MENENINAVYDVFKAFFGEERVDLQRETNTDSAKIIIHFPIVTVTNEYDKSIDITHLWVRVLVSKDGSIIGTFEMIRSEYTVVQLISGYSHSHIPSRDSYNISQWSKPCLGSGPIRNTIISLTGNFNKELWELFCYELSKYVTVESISGTPYKRLEDVGLTGRNVIVLPFPGNNLNLEYSHQYYFIIEDFIQYIVKRKPFKFNFFNNSYGIAMSNKELLITLSNVFIEYYNSLSQANKHSLKDVLFTYILYKGKFINGFLYYNNDSPYNSDTSTMLSYEGTTLLEFKGKLVKLHIIKQTTNNDPNIFLFLNPDIVKIIMSKILALVNNKYGELTNTQNASIKEVRKFI